MRIYIILALVIVLVVLAVVMRNEDASKPGSSASYISEVYETQPVIIRVPGARFLADRTMLVRAGGPPG